MLLSIVLLTWNSRPFIVNCLDALLTQLPKETEIIIIDNGSTDDSIQIIQQQYPQVRLVCNETNQGVGPARNQGLKIAQGQYILILDIDTIVQPNAIPLLLHSMETNPQVGLVGAKLLDINYQLQYTCRNFPTLLGKFGRQLPLSLQNHLLNDEELRNWSHETRRHVGYVIGACQMIRRTAMQEIGYYDDHIFYGPEDVDYCLRMWQAGWQVLYVPEAVILHLEQRMTRKRFWRNRMFWIHLQGLAWYFWKHQYLFRPPQFLELKPSPSH